MKKKIGKIKYKFIGNQSVYPTPDINVYKPNRVCMNCKTKLSIYNPYKLCYACKIKLKSDERGFIKLGGVLDKPLRKSKIKKLTEED
jgi:hypothetical protein